MASVQNVSLKQIVAACDVLGQLVDGMIEPNSLAMVVGMTKNVMFTKITSKVLSEVEVQHPFQKIIHDAAFLYTQETGDDSKVFLLLFKEIMKGIETMLIDSNEIEMRLTMLQQLSYLKSFLPDILKSILSSYAVFSNFSFCSSPKELEDLVSSFFDSKFSVSVAKKLSYLMCSFLSHSISDSSHAIDTLAYFISNFDAFCSKTNAPLSESTILEGFLLHHRLSPMWKHTKMVYFVVILDLSCKSDDAVWETSDKYFSQKLGSLWNYANNGLKNLKSLDISLILTNDGISRDFESLCSQNEMLIISRVPKEDIDNILHLVNISPMNNLYDSVDPQNIGCLQSLTSHVVGDASFTHLKVAAVNNHAYLNPHHIFLCASLEEVLKDYSSECLNCLKAVRQWLQPINKELFHKGSMSKCQEIQKYLSNDSDKFLNNFNDPKSETLSTYALGVAFPFGLFEFALKNVLVDFCCDKISSVGKLCYILDSALLTVVHKLWNTPRLVIEERSYIEFHKKIKCRITNPIEPASTKENLLHRVLQLIEQLIKIDAILSKK